MSGLEREWVLKSSNVWKQVNDDEAQGLLQIEVYSKAVAFLMGDMLYNNSSQRIACLHIILIPILLLYVASIPYS